MREKHYKKLSKKEKAKIVSMVIAGESIEEASRRTKTTSSSIGMDGPRLEESTLQALCPSCHARKSTHEGARFGKE